MFSFRNIKWTLIFVFGVLFQSIIVDYLNLLSIKEVRPNFVIIILIFFGFNFGGVYATIVGFSVGLIQGLGFLGGGFIGLSSLTKSIIGFYFGLFQKSKRKWNNLFFLLVLLCGCLIHNFLFLYIYTFGSEINIFSMLIKNVLPTSIYTTIVGMMIFYVFKK